MGMNHLGEIANMTEVSRPTASVITNIGTSHIRKSWLKRKYLEGEA